MEEEVHLKSTVEYIQVQNTAHSQALIEKFIESCLTLDASPIEPYIHEEDVFEDKSKYLFLASLQQLFDKIKMMVGKDFKVTKSHYTCLGCNYGKPVLRFDISAGNQSTSVYDFGYLIQEKDGVVIDIFKCELYKQRKGKWIKPQGLPAIYLDYEKELEKYKR
jgi:hypothetical protein